MSPARPYIQYNYWMWIETPVWYCVDVLLIFSSNKHLDVDWNNEVVAKWFDSRHIQFSNWMRIETLVGSEWFLTFRTFSFKKNLDVDWNQLCLLSLRIIDLHPTYLDEDWKPSNRENVIAQILFTFSLTIEWGLKPSNMLNQLAWRPNIQY